jgi:hypothetical protein
MTAFHLLFTEERRAFAAVVRISKLEYRANMRFRLWERPADDPVVVDLLERIALRRDLCTYHEEVECHLDQLLDKYSRYLPPHGVVDEDAAYRQAVYVE